MTEELPELMERALSETHVRQYLCAAVQGVLDGTITLEGVEDERWLRVPLDAINDNEGKAVSLDTTTDPGFVRLSLVPWVEPPEGMC